jgi:DcuC family C4-dicarboxylate transporter
VLIFDGKWGPQLHIITILVICMLLAAVLEFVRGFNTKVFSGLEVLPRYGGCLRRRRDAAGCRGRVCQGLSTIGFIQSLIPSTLVRLCQYYPDAGAGGADHAGSDDHRFR